jgi:hypothetical protein
LPPEHNGQTQCQDYSIVARLTVSFNLREWCNLFNQLTKDQVFAMRFHILFTLLFVSMSVASIVNNNTKISLLPYCAMRSAAIKIGQAVSPSLSAYTVCERDRLACYGVGSIRDYPLPATQTKCDSAFAACIMIEIAPLPIHTKLRVCLSVF